MAKTRLGRNESINGWGFIAPALTLIGIFMIWPILWSLWMSFQTGRGMALSFGGLSNIKRLAADPIFLKALTNTLTYLAIQVPVMIMLALVFAVMLNSPKLKGRAFFRTAIFLPSVTALVAYSILFKSMFATDGLMNEVVLGLGLVDSPIPWLSDPFWAKVVIISAITWRWTGYNMIFYLAALQNVDRSIYEAAKIDGVPAYAQFFRITIPMLKPVILFTTIISTIGTLQLFDEVQNITQGGPSNATLTLSQYIYNLTFKFMPSFGYAATVSYVIVILVALLSLVQFYVARDRK
ncbi:carbohydrate ABC transporter permease [Pelagovum pacificum]|uniref:Sugar ABC transporter permease n=1 Tax=Pelagovum pacificum TaxID=2588711 RepID=A0A5C5GDZ8_9RHOB|nr:sugar ABC transporter permease [Pelagovum pacificum]QQA43863.1 sugar ABC transporter permease [Pelagovum pacificum]TNY33005.1 sugar ABC transporter permease [Pelagovum pacificum]